MSIQLCALHGMLCRHVKACLREPDPKLHVPGILVGAYRYVALNQLAKPTLVPHTCDFSHLRRRGRPAVDVMPQAKCDRCDGPK